MIRLKPVDLPLTSFLVLLSLLAISLLIQNPYLGYFTIGGLLGAGLNYFQFGFRTCSQQLLSDGRTLGIRSVLIMLAVTTFLFFPLLEIGHYSTPKLTGFVQPLSLSVIFGAFIFGIGMQLSNGCTSGTLNKLGQLQPLSFTAFIFLLVGGTLAAYHHEFWRAVPALNAISLPQTFGWFPALILQLGVIALLYRWLLAREKKRYQDVVPLIPSFKNIRQWHPWLLAGILLALLNTLLLITSGQPWSIANIFPLWGLKFSQQAGLPLDFSFWDYGITYAERLESPVWTDTVSLTTLGLVFGALLVSLLGRVTRPASSPQIQNTRRIDWQSHLLAVIGGFIMGYGAVIAFGCNIGAFFSGIGSGSLHGWLWAISALLGNAIVIYFKALQDKRLNKFRN